MATDLLSGEYTSAFKGRGMEFDEVRNYLPGDDVRAIDWNVSARMGEPYLKVFKEEREMTMMIVLDVSSSLYFGSKDRAKYQYAAELAAVLAFLATKNNDKVGLILYSDHIEAAVSPAKGKAHIWNLIRKILTHEPKSGSTSTEAASKKATLNLCKRKSMVFLISDFWDQGFDKLFKQIAKKHDLSCFEIVDAKEKELFSAGVISVEDRESSRNLLIDSYDLGLRESYMKAFEEKKTERIRNLSRKSGANYLYMDSSDPIASDLAYFFKRKEHKRS